MRFMDFNSKEWKTCKETDYEELIQQLKAGALTREKAMNCLFEKLFYQVYEMKRDFGKLDDEAIIGAYSKALLNALKEIINDKFRGESSLPTWFRTIFRRRCVDALRYNSPNKSVTQEEKSDQSVSQNTETDTNIFNPQIITLPESREIADNSENPEEALSLKELAREERLSFHHLIDSVAIAMDQLTDKCKQLLQAYFEGYHMDEIAQMNELKNAHTARQSVFRCRGRLRKALLQELETAIGELGENCQQLVEAYFGGSSTEKIAERYGWDEKKTQRKLSNCFTALRAIIAENKE